MRTSAKTLGSEGMVQGQVDLLRARAIAFYLPQFHPIPENDLWWGNGFTEWTNVAKARPLFPGHQQPKLPGALGFYDLRLAETRAAQAELARNAGIEGFCYWHYWFGNGRRILERPFAEVLKSGEPDFPFCLAWANQTWSGIWHGSPDRILVKQEYPGLEDYRRHFEALIPAFTDPRYMKVDGKPIFVVYCPRELPSFVEFTETWRACAAEAGLPGLHLVAMSHEASEDLLAAFDAVTPNGPSDFLLTRKRFAWREVFRALFQSLPGKRVWPYLVGPLAPPRRYDFAEVVAWVTRNAPRHPRFLPGVLAGWDNTPRSGDNGVVFENSTPEIYEKFLRAAVEMVADKPEQERIVFIKAWNEWAEGNYLEPDREQGDGFLEATRRVLRGSPR